MCQHIGIFTYDKQKIRKKQLTISLKYGIVLGSFFEKCYFGFCVMTQTETTNTEREENRKNNKKDCGGIFG